ncbi:cis-prenyltransferase 4, chloroplastic [Ziziphus jujuba]|uniref:Alkyl transferase n=1 Tax=Ziziphus jujuba TaxID=326968 RepID=A0ABM3I2R5_ZIZJJ|nr:cis-prenyltransferase 4, chloroplastic [Ziziphus jujuba]
MFVSLQFRLPPTVTSTPPLKLLPPNAHVPSLSSMSVRHVRRLRLPRLSLRATPQLVVVEDDEERGANGRPHRDGASTEERNLLPPGLRRETMPVHVAVIMDGNRRWAQIRGLPASSGYEAGVRSLRSVVELCCKLGISVLTVFAFSTENWCRPKVEIEFLMDLFGRAVREDLESFLRENIRISVIGNTSKLPNSLQQLIANVEETTKKNFGLQLIVAVSYSGQYDIVQACQRIAMKVKDGVVALDDVNESLIERELETNCTQFPYPDLLIRTSGELRISNFLLWQLAYTELFFSKSLWPDFGEIEFLEALQDFQRRQRRYCGRSLN